jgi:hypothetical protein
METLYENSYKVSKESYIYWFKHPVRKNYFYIVWIILGAFSLACAISSLLNGGFFLGLFILFTAFCIYRAFFRNRFFLSRQFKAISLLQGESEWDRNIRLGEYISVTDGHSETQYQWAQVTEVIVDKEYIILVLGKAWGVRLVRNSFTKGDFDGFIGYMKTQHNTIPVRVRGK